MEVWKIKHIPTGLFYQPLRNGVNLSKKGKMYTEERFAKASFGSTKTHRIQLYKDSIVYKHLKLKPELNFQVCPLATYCVYLDAKPEDWVIEKY